jgi:beta-glucanase (GH16 family)
VFLYQRVFFIIEKLIKGSCNKKIVISILAVIIIVLPLNILILTWRHNVNSEQYASGPQPLGRRGNWNLVFDDEFNETTLDTTKWVPCFRWGTNAGCDSSTTPQSWYLPSNVIVSNGTLKLKAQNRSVTENGTIYPYTSGMITTGPWDNTGSAAKFAFIYGYMEIRAKVPKGQGLWPAFWALPTDASWPPEIDVSEILNGAGLTTYTNNMTYHYVDVTSDTHQSSSAGWTSPVDLASDFHVYAVDWEPDGIHWYVDGVERRTAFTDSKNITAKQMYLLVQLQAGGSWPGSPDSRTPFPSVYEVDYIRVWQHCTTNCPTAAPTPTSTPVPTPTSAESPLGPNLIANPSCETNTSGWAGYQAVLSVNTTVAHSGNASCNVAQTTGTVYSMNDNPNTVTNPQLEQQYYATAYVRSDASVGKPAWLAIRLSGGANPAKTIYSPTSVTLSNAWQQLTNIVTVDYADRTSLEVYLVQENATAGDSFQADDISLQLINSSPTPTKTPP